MSNDDLNTIEEHLKRLADRDYGDSPNLLSVDLVDALQLILNELRDLRFRVEGNQE